MLVGFPAIRLFDEGIDKFEKMCHIVTDASRIQFSQIMSPSDVPFFIQPFEIVYVYGKPEFQAQILWEEEVCVMLCIFPPNSF